MKSVLIAGGSGLIGMRLSELLLAKGYKVNHLSRSPKPDAKYPRYVWDVKAQTIDDQAVLDADYIINLAGAGIVGSHWTKARKKLIIDSRVNSTKLLLDSIKRLKKPLGAYIASAAIGYYGDRGEELLDEESDPGIGFLSESCMAWEEAIAKANDQDLRTVAIRTGIVLSTKGGALEKMLISYNFFTGAYFGNGQQWYSWIHIDDLCGVFIKAIEDEKMNGIYNGVSPNPARNKEMIHQIGPALNKPAFVLPAPAFMMRLAMGEMADTILFSTKVSAEKLLQAGFKFQFPELLDALLDLLERKI